MVAVTGLEAREKSDPKRGAAWRVRELVGERHDTKRKSSGAQLARQMLGGCRVTRNEVKRQGFKFWDYAVLAELCPCLCLLTGCTSCEQ